MRHFLSFSLAFSILVSAWPSHSEADGTSAATVPSHTLKIVEDQEAGAFRFLIDGKIIAIIDAEGLSVRESIEFGGTLTDVGTAHFDARVGKNREASDAD